jgi:hypothetical protein
MADDPYHDPYLEKCTYPGCTRLEYSKASGVCHKHEGLLPSIGRGLHATGRLIEACSDFIHGKIYKW